MSIFDKDLVTKELPMLVRLQNYFTRLANYISKDMIESPESYHPVVIGGDWDSGYAGPSGDWEQGYSIGLSSAPDAVFYDAFKRKIIDFNTGKDCIDQDMTRCNPLSIFYYVGVPSMALIEEGEKFNKYELESPVEYYESIASVVKKKEKKCEFIKTTISLPRFLIFSDTCYEYI